MAGAAQGEKMISFHELKYWHIERRRERLIMWVVWKMPKWLVYWASIRLISHATTGKYGNQIVPELTATDALKRWEDK
jgi:hypothetical protein